jgi:hypothetical protein
MGDLVMVEAGLVGVVITLVDWSKLSKHILATKAPDDRTSASEPSIEDMIARLTSQITTLQTRISDSSSETQGYHSPSPSLSLHFVLIKSMNVLRGLAIKTIIDKT